MRANTNPCSVCEYCDDSCDVCLHLPYELADPAFYREASSDEDEDEDSQRGGASSDVASDDSDEDGSWFTTPWSKLIAQRVAGYEVDPEIGVQLTPIEPHADEDEEENEVVQEARARNAGKHRRRKEDSGQEKKEQENEDEGLRSGRGARRLRRRRRRGSTPARVGAVEDPQPPPAEAVVEVEGDRDSAADEARTEDAATATVQPSDNSETKPEDATNAAESKAVPQPTETAVEVERSRNSAASELPEEGAAPALDVAQRSDSSELKSENAPTSAVSRPAESPVELEGSRGSVVKEVRTEDPAAVYVSAQQSGNGELRSEDTPNTAMRANGAVRAEFIRSTSAAANDEVQGGNEAVPKDAHDNTWRESVQSCVPLVSVS